MGKALTSGQRAERRHEELEHRRTKYAEQDKREEEKRQQEENRQVSKLKKSKEKVTTYDLFKEVLLGFHTHNIVERPSLVNLELLPSIKRPPIPEHLVFQGNEYVPDKSLITKRTRLKKWSKSSSYEHWCKKEGISSSLLASILSNNEKKFDDFMEQKKSQIIEIDNQLQMQKDKHNKEQEIKKLELEESNLSASVKFDNDLKDYRKLKAVETLQLIEKS